MGLRIALLATLWIACGCSASGEDPSRPATGALPSGTPATGSAASPGAIDLPASILDPVVAEVARVAGVPIDQVTVLSARAMTFPDAGLGCPEPGMVYAQVLVDGYKILAEAGGTTYDYRGSGARFRRCQTTR
jgi:hypothetical protein